MIAEFARRKGSKDKTKRKRRVIDPDTVALQKSISGATLGAIVGGGASAYLSAKKISNKIKKNPRQGYLLKDPIALNKITSRITRKAGKAALLAGAIGAGGLGYLGYRNAKKQNKILKEVKYNCSFDLVEFARKKGSKDKQKRKRRNKNLQNLAGAGIGASTLGYLGYKIPTDPNQRQALDRVNNSLDEYGNAKYKGKQKDYLSKLQADVTNARNADARGYLRLEGKGFKGNSGNLEEELKDLAYKRGKQLSGYKKRQIKAINEVSERLVKLGKTSNALQFGTLGAIAGIGATTYIRNRKDRKKK